MKIPTFWIVLFVLLLLAVAIRLSTPRLGSVAALGVNTIEGNNVLAECPTGSMNCVSSESSDSSIKPDRFVIENQPDNAIATLSKIISEQSGARLVNVEERYIHATFSTPLMGYVDDVEFLLSDGDASIQVRSASRLGKSDLGTNAKRVEQLRQVVLGRL